MTMKISVNVIKQGRHVLVAACDADLLGKTLKFGTIDFKVREDFYGGSLVHVEEAVSLIKNATDVNLVGSIIINRAIKEKLVHPQAVLDISGVPHAQIIKL